MIIRIFLIYKNGLFVTPTVMFFLEKNFFRILATFYRIKVLYDEYNQVLHELRSINAQDNVALKRI
jgi:hypothetical protein